MFNGPHLNNSVDVDVERLIDETTRGRCVHPVRVVTTWRGVRVCTADHNVLFRVQIVVHNTQLFNNLFRVYVKSISILKVAFDWLTLTQLITSSRSACVLIVISATAMTTRFEASVTSPKIKVRANCLECMPRASCDGSA